MDWIETLIVAIVEGLTEFLPVSSTGHMIIAQNLLGVPQGDPFVRFHIYHSVWCHPLGGVSLLEEILPVRPFTGACRQFDVAEAEA